MKFYALKKTWPYVNIKFLKKEKMSVQGIRKPRIQVSGAFCIIQGYLDTSSLPI